MEAACSLENDYIAYVTPCLHSLGPGPIPIIIAMIHVSLGYNAKGRLPNNGHSGGGGGGGGGRQIEEH